MPVHVERDGPVMTVILDEPAVRNAVDRVTADALADAFRAFEADESAAVAVLWGAGGTFCSGANLKAIAEGQDRANRVAADGDGPMGPSRMLLRKPVIAAIAGHAVAGGLELALWCDLRVVEEDAVLGVFCRRWGVPLIDGGTVRLPRIVGLGRALDLILTGRAVEADEALAIGLATRVVPVGESRAAAEALAHELAAHPQLCLRHDRLSAYEQGGLSIDVALASELANGLVALEHEAGAGAARFAGGAGRGGAAVGDGAPGEPEAGTGGPGAVGGMPGMADAVAGGPGAVAGGPGMADAVAGGPGGAAGGVAEPGSGGAPPEPPAP